MSPNLAQLESVLAAAERTLRARQDRMLTAEEWTALARTVADATGCPPTDLLSEWDLHDESADPDPD